MTTLEGTAQAFIFFLAGYETTSSTITYTLYQLAKNLKVQQKLLSEIDDVCKNPDAGSYNSLLNEMPYLHSVICGKFWV